MAEQTYMEGYLAGLREAASIATQEIEDDPGYLRFAEDGKDIADEIREEIKRVTDKEGAPGMARIMVEGAQPLSFYAEGAQPLTLYTLITALRDKPQRGQDVFALMALYERQRIEAADALTAQCKRLVDMQAKVQEWRTHADELAKAIGNVLIKSGIHREGSGGLNGPDMLAACAKLGELVDSLQRTDSEKKLARIDDFADRMQKVVRGKGIGLGMDIPNWVAGELTELKEWRENALELLKDDADVVRMHEGNGPESLVGSLAITMLKTRKQRDEWLNKHRQALATLDSRNTQMAGLVSVLNAVERDLRNRADTLDQWASEGRSNGWSTHQVAANRAMADTCRRDAVFLRRTTDKL